MTPYREHLRLVLLEGAGAPEDDLNDYNACYRAWKSVWQSTFHELGKSKVLYSDGFSRQTRIAALFDGDVCIALTCLRRTDFRLESMKDDSLLSAWTDSAYQKLIRDGTDIVVCSYLTVVPEYRRVLSCGIETRDLAAAMAVKAFIDMGGDAMTGTMRTSRRTERVAYGNGATFLEDSYLHDSVAQLVSFYYVDAVAHFQKPQPLIYEELWRNRKVCPAPPATKIVKHPAAKAG